MDALIQAFYQNNENSVVELALLIEKQGWLVFISKLPQLMDTDPDVRTKGYYLYYCSNQTYFIGVEELESRLCWRSFSF